MSLFQRMVAVSVRDGKNKWAIGCRVAMLQSPKTVPKRTNQLLEAGIDEEFLWRSHVDLPEKLYGKE